MKHSRCVITDNYSAEPQPNYQIFRFKRLKTQLHPKTSELIETHTARLSRREDEALR